MSGVTYDTGALVAADPNDRAVWAVHAGFLGEEVVPTVPTPALAEAWRGGAGHGSLSRFLRLCGTEEQAQAVGALSGRSGHPDIVDVSVMDGAAPRRGDRHGEPHPHRQGRQGGTNPPDHRTHLTPP